MGWVCGSERGTPRITIARYRNSVSSRRSYTSFQCLLGHTVSNDGARRKYVYPWTGQAGAKCDLMSLTFDNSAKMLILPLKYHPLHIPHNVDDHAD